MARPSRLAAFATATVAAAATAAVVVAPRAANAYTTTTFATPGTYSYTVPSGVNALRVLARGGQGGAADFGSGAGGGPGAALDVRVRVVPGEVLAVTVGGAADWWAGAVNGGYGGSGRWDGYRDYVGGNGGGMSAVARVGGVYAVVAGGGGGGGGSSEYAWGGWGGEGGIFSNAEWENGGNGYVLGDCPRGGGGGFGGRYGGAGGLRSAGTNAATTAEGTTGVATYGSVEHGGSGGNGGYAGGGGGGGGYVGGGGGGAALDDDAVCGSPRGGGGGGGGGASYLGEGVVPIDAFYGYGNGLVTITPVADVTDGLLDNATVPPSPEPTVPPTPEPTVPPTPQPTLPPTPQPTVPGGPGRPSDDCATGQTVADGFAGSTYVRVRTLLVSATTTYVCVRADGPALAIGGRFSVVGSSVEQPAPPGADTAAGSCATTPGNAVPGPHPIQSGSVGDPSDPSTYLPFALDAYATNAEAWVCVTVGTARHRVVVRTPAQPAAPAVTFAPDPPGHYATEPPPSLGNSAQCRAGAGAAGRLVDAATAAGRVTLYEWRPAATVVKVCVRADTPAGVGGVLTLDTSAAGGALPTVTTGTNAGICPLSVARLDNPGIEVRRSTGGSVCVQWPGGVVTATVTAGSGQQPATVTWTPDPGTPG